MISELMVFVKDSSAPYEEEEEDVKLAKFSGGIKMKKIIRKFRSVLR